MNRVVVLDTNVLLADPNSILSFPRADVVIPETVLGELDKLKTARVDPDLRFRGREVSRILFDLSEEGSLVEGVELPDGGTLRVAPLDPATELPNGLGTRNADDRILASVYQLRQADPEAEISLVTNDLNMLLKAQTLGISVERYADGVESGFARRFLIRPFQRYRAPLTILAVAVAVFAGVVAIALFTQQKSSDAPIALTAEFRNLLTPAQQGAFDALSNLQTHPTDPESLRTMANFYYDERNVLAQTDPVAALDTGQQAIRYFERYLAVAPQDNNARVDMSALLFYTGQTDQAIQLVGDVLKQDKNNVNANYNLGVFYWQGPRRDFTGAAAQFEKVLALTKNDTQQHGAYLRAQSALAQLAKDAAAAGRTLPTTAGVTTQ
jgi:tetratricopeptide (TPR) repeat protein